MKLSYTSLIAVMLVVIAVAIAGCSSSSPAAPAGGGQTTAAPAATSSGSSSGSSTGGSGSAVTGASLFGGLSYNWVEYKISTGSGDQSMTIYYKYDKSGKCTMRFEGAGAANMPANMQNIDCSPKPGATTQSDPNKVSSDAQVTCSPLTESVSVPAGTFDATKCTVTSQGHTSTTWVAKDKFMVKMESSSDAGAVNMVLNAYG